MLAELDEEELDLGAWGEEEETKQPSRGVKQDGAPPNHSKDGVSPYETDWNSYITWHKNHPQTSTPRKVRASTVTSQLYVCEDHPQFAYIQTQKGHGKNKKISKDFVEIKTGKDAQFKEVTQVAHDLEHQYRLEKRSDHLDPWWMHSVKVQSNIFHTKDTNPNNLYLAEGDENDQDLLTNDLFEKYNQHQSEREKKLRQREEDLAISAAWGKPNRHIKRSKLDKAVRSKYTIDGKNELSDFYQDRLERIVKIALDEYYLTEKFRRSSNDSTVEEEEVTGKKGEGKYKSQSDNSAKKSFISSQLQLLESQGDSGGGPGVTALPQIPSISKSQSKHVHPNLAKFQEYEDYKTALGGEKEIKKLTENLVKYSKKVNKQNQSNEILSIMDRGMDFLDACLHLNYVQVRCLLNFGADPNSLTCDEEPVFFLIFQKVIFIDGRILDEENRQKNTDRKSCLKILSSLLEFGADINCVVNNQTPLHLSCARGDNSMTQWLLEHHANPNSQCGPEGVTPLMIAAKFSFPECIILLIRYEGDINKQNVLGRTALHYAAQFGQSKISKFLLRLGAQKDVKDEDHLTPGELALACNYMATSQVINGFCSPQIPAKEPLNYILNRLSAEDKVKNKKVLFFLDSNGATRFGNLFSAKEHGDSIFQRCYDRMVEWKRWYDMTPWNEIVSAMFSWNASKNSEAMVHPE